MGRGVGCPVPGDGLVGMLTLGREPVGLRGVVGAACSSYVYVDAHGLVCSEREDVLFRGFSQVMLLVDVDGALTEDVLCRDSDDGGDGGEEAVPVPRGGVSSNVEWCSLSWMGVGACLVMSVVGGPSA